MQCRRPSFDPWVRKIPWRRDWRPTPVFFPGEFHRQRSPVGYSSWGHKEMDTNEWLRLTNWLIGYQSDQQRVMLFIAPLISIVESSDLKLEWSLARAWGKYLGRSVMWVGHRWIRHWSKEMYREQENSHLEWPDPTLHPYKPLHVLKSWPPVLLPCPRGHVGRGPLTRCHTHMQQPQRVKRVDSVDT